MAFDMSFRFRLRVVTANDISRCIYALTMTQPCDVKHANTVHVDGFCVFVTTGRRFAEQEMSVLIVKLLQNFRLKWPTSDVMEQRYNMLLTPDRQADIQFIPRT